jgi:transcriptional regulator with XRE-family HTH domain
MFSIRPGQIKAARAILDWSQDDLALASRLSVGTIRNIEQGNYPRNATLNLVREALENAGIEFLDCDGVKKRAEEVAVYQGHDSSQRFREDITGCGAVELIAISKSQTMFAASLGLQDLSQEAGVQNAKCLVSEIHSPAASQAAVEFRTIPKFHVGPTCYFVYKDRYAVVVTEDNRTFRYIVFKSTALAHSYRTEFAALWDMAFPLNAEVRDAARRIRT